MELSGQRAAVPLPTELLGMRKVTWGDKLSVNVLPEGVLLKAARPSYSLAGAVHQSAQRAGCELLSACLRSSRVSFRLTADMTNYSPCRPTPSDSTLSSVLSGAVAVITLVVMGEPSRSVGRTFDNTHPLDRKYALPLARISQGCPSLSEGTNTRTSLPARYCSIIKSLFFNAAPP